MFFKNLKNIFIQLKNNNIKNMKKYIVKLKYDAYRAQTGGGEFMKELQDSIQPSLDKLNVNMNYLKITIEVLNIISDMLSKMDISKFEELETINNIIIDIKQILEKRLSLQQS
jgi:Ran GTPase-activating protein (RanGAP) involved in mRNA processing and transport